MRRYSRVIHQSFHQPTNQCRRCLHLSTITQTQTQSYDQTTSRQSVDPVAHQSAKQSVYDVEPSSPFSFLSRAPSQVYRPRAREPLLRPSSSTPTQTSQSDQTNNQTNIQSTPSLDSSLNQSPDNQSNNQPAYQSINPPDFEMEILLNPFLQEDTKLEGISVVGVGDWCFDVRQASAIPRSNNQITDQTQTITMALLHDSNDTSNNQSNNQSITHAPTIIENDQPIKKSVEKTDGEGILEPGVIEMRGSIVVTPTVSFLWTPGSVDEITRDSLAVLELIWPRPELVLFGTGTKVNHLSEDVIDYLYELNLPYELFESVDAAGTFNIMVEEQRRIVAFIIASGKQERNAARISPRKQIQGNLPSRRLRDDIERKLAQVKK